MNLNVVEVLKLDEVLQNQFVNGLLNRTSFTNLSSDNVFKKANKAVLSFGVKAKARIDVAAVLALSPQP